MTSRQWQQMEKVGAVLSVLGVAAAMACFVTMHAAVGVSRTTLAAWFISSAAVALLGAIVLGVARVVKG